MLNEENLLSTNEIDDLLDVFPTDANFDELSAKILGNSSELTAESGIAENIGLPDKAAFNNAPEPLPEGLLPVPVLPAELLPESLQDWLTDISDRMQCPLEFPAVAAIISAAVLIGNKIRIRPKQKDNWTVTVNLWGAIVGKPGELKTPALEQAIKPLKLRENIAVEEYEKNLREFEFSKMEKEIKFDVFKGNLKKAVKENQNTENLRSDYIELEVEQPTARRYITNDSTVESITELHAANENGLLLFRDELLGLIKSFDRDGRQQDRPFFLEAWNGFGSYVSDRIGRGTTRVENLTISILGGIQPTPLSVYMNAAVASNKNDDGFIQRFQLLIYPDATKKWKNVDRVPNEQAAQAANDIFARLDQLLPEEVCVEGNGNDAANFLRFSDEAQSFFDDWRAKLEHNLRSDYYEHPALEAHFAKYRSLFPSLALIFHMIEFAAGNVGINTDDVNFVQLASAEKAAAWCDYLEQHAYRIYAMGANANTDSANVILKKLREGKLSNPFTIRDIYRKKWTGLQSPELCAKPLALLVEFGWLQAFAVASSNNSGGRPMTQYHAHPSIFKENKK